MTLFLATYLAIYGAINSYLYWKLIGALPHMGKW